MGKKFLDGQGNPLPPWMVDRELVENCDRSTLEDLSVYLAGEYVALETQMHDLLASKARLTREIFEREKKLRPSHG